MRVLSFLKPYRVPVAAALSLMLIELAVELLHPLLMARVIDEGIVKRDFSVVLTWGGVMLAMSLLAFGAGLMSSFLASHTSQSFGYDVRQRLFEKVQSFSFANVSSFATSSLVTRMTNDVTQLQNTIFMSLRIAMRAPLLLIGGMLMAGFVNMKLALILLVTIPPLCVFLGWMLGKGSGLFRSVQGRVDEVNSVMRESLTGMRLIRGFFRMGHEAERFTDANERLRSGTSRSLRMMEVTMPVLLLVMNTAILAVLWFGGTYVTAGEATIGEVVAIVNYALRITSVFSVFSFIIMAFSRAHASGARIQEVLDTEVDVSDAEEVTEAELTGGHVVFEHVSFQYPGSASPALQDLSFTLEPGQTAAVIGATGAGKTTLFQLIPRLYDVSEGSVQLDGHDIRTMKLEHVRGKIGMVPQEAMLFTGTIRENIAWGKTDASMEEIVEAARHAQIHDTICRLPQQYETVLGQKGINLSGGQKQRISIARALVRKPKLLLLDDSTSALDAKTEALLLEALRHYTCTTLIITQKISTAMSADTILLLEDGVLSAKGTHEELLRESALYKQIFQSQQGEAAHA